MSKIFSFTLLITVYLISCSKESFTTSSDAQLLLSEDSLSFDTLFTTTGSITHYFKIFNQNNRKLRISSIALSGKEESFFNINADGAVGPEVRDLEIEANDSLYVFVTAKIDPNTGNLPFIVQDSIFITWNGNVKKVRLSAWGQNANFLRSVVLDRNTLWTNTKPYVVLGGLIIEENVVLTIQKGTSIYMHADAPLIVKGKILAIGEHYDSTKIIFQGDRLDAGYKDYPGAWPGIYFNNTSTGSILKHVIVKNGYQGIVAEGTDDLTLEECIIDNCYDAGLIGSRANLKAVNCLISNCGKNIMLIGGGNYEFIHCTSAAISNNFIQHKDPSLVITDFIKDGNDIITSPLKASFINSIIWGAYGSVEDEVITVREGNQSFEANFTNCLWKVNNSPQSVTTVGIIENEDPLFSVLDTRSRIYDFQLQEGSLAIGAGSNIGIIKDLNGKDRKVNNPDIGAYETEF